MQHPGEISTTVMWPVDGALGLLAIRVWQVRATKRNLRVLDGERLRQYSVDRPYACAARICVTAISRSDKA